jgi:hypothetical protein
LQLATPSVICHSRTIGGRLFRQCRVILTQFIESPCGRHHRHLWNS